MEFACFLGKIRKIFKNYVCWIFSQHAKHWKVTVLYPYRIWSESLIVDLEEIMLVMWVGICTSLEKIHFTIQKVLIYFLFLHENICCRYSLEVPQWGTSNEYPQYTCTLSWRNAEGLQMSTHNICFCGEKRKIFSWYPLLSRPMSGLGGSVGCAIRLETRR